MYKVKVLQGYRITLPKDVRERWNLKVGEEVEILVEGSRLIVHPIKLPSDPIQLLCGIVSGEKTELKETEKAVAEELEEKMERGK
ncbi:MAG: AbrB/MazE/SpoVT family DNA-binding domain-containing protein [Nitrososphaeria archaeon]